MKLIKQLIILTILLSSTFLTGCGSVELFDINKDGTFSGAQCEEHNPNYDIVMFESKFCSHCKDTLPVFLEICEAKGVTPIVLDLSVPEDMARMRDEYKVSIQYTPTFLFGCDYVVGAQTGEEYSRLIDICEQYMGEN